MITATLFASLEAMREGGRCAAFTRCPPLTDSHSSSCFEPTRVYSMGHLKSTYRELLVAAHRETGEYKIPS